MKIITLVCAVIPLLLPLHDANNGVFYIIALYYIGVLLMLTIVLRESKQCH
jgi:hypothetical protein